MDRVMEFAETVAMRSRRTAARLKDAVYRGIEKTLDEGLIAFAERRQPVFD
jgi:hypothetical protein